MPYSPERRTALVLCGTGAHGAYHAGVLRALQEAGVKIDMLAGQGVGAAGAALAAIDGAGRLWEANGVWHRAAARPLYAWRWPLRIAIWLFAGMLAALVAPLLLLTFGRSVPPSPFLVTSLVLAIALMATLARAGGAARRRSDGAWWWRLFGAPVDAQTARQLFTAAIWDLIRGAAPAPQPLPATLARKYTEVLAENLGQPGFRELVLVTTDIDARRDVVAALVREPFRVDFLAPRPGRDRRAEVLDLAGIGRDHVLDVVAGALTPPLVCDPHLATFAPDSFWRGETHRLSDRPAAIHRLLEEVAVAGATQAIVVSAVAPTAVPHRLRLPRLDVRHRLGEFLAADESAALRDALEMARLRYDSVYVICPAHNPVGPFDFAGAYDEASDRRQQLGELMERAYEDAYRQFIEPVVGASGEHLARAAVGGRAFSEEQADGEGVLDDLDSRG